MGTELVLGLGETAACEGTDALVAAVASQHRRVVDLAGSWSPSEWRAATRCPRWDAHGVLLHLVWGTEMARALLAHEPLPFETQTLDPRVFPNAYVDEHAEQPVEETVAALSGATEALLEVLAGDLEGERFPFFYPWPVEWRVVVVHLHWDAWLHERDVLLPAGRIPGSDDAETRLALAYGLTVAGFSASMARRALDGALAVGGVGAGTYRIGVAADGVTVRVSPPDGPEDATGPDAGALADALSGRGADVAAVCGRRDELTGALSGLREFFLAPP